MYKSFLVKYGEIGVKGKNRYIFENMLMEQIRHALKTAEGEFEVTKEQGRIYVNVVSDDYDYDETVEALSRVFGIVGFCPLLQVEDEGFDKLAETVVDYLGKEYPEKNFTFKVNARRARKNYPLDSMEINAELGEKILDAFPESKVDVHNPEVMVCIEIRSLINIYSKEIPAYTSERAKQKVVDLAKLVARYSGPINLHVVNFTDIQLYIYEKCPHEELTIIMRRYMMKLAEHFAKENRCLGLITGESIGQVASQTMQSLAATNEVCTMPVYRPLIGFDKQEIVEVSEKIDTYETSIQPFEDCCTIFVAKHPVTKPNIEYIKKSETKLEEKIDELMQTAIDTVEVIHVEAE